MDNNQPINPNQPPGGVIQPQPPTQIPNPITVPPVSPIAAAPEPKKPGSKLPFILIGIVILLIIASGVIFFIMSTSGSNPTPTKETSQVEQKAEEIKVLSAELENELNFIDLGSIDQDLTEIDSDLSQL